MGMAGAAEVVITQTVKDLVAGSRFDLKERGVYELKGVPGSWTLFDVLAVDEVLRPQPIEGATVASERRARASAAPSPKRSLRWLIPAAAAVALVLIAATIVATRPSAAYLPAAGSVARIERGTADRIARSPWGRTRPDSVPVRVASGLWISRGRSTGSIHLGGTGSRGTVGTPTGVAVGNDAVWITSGFGTGRCDGGVSRLDPTTGQLAPAFDTAVGSEAIAWGADQLWVPMRTRRA